MLEPGTIIGGYRIVRQLGRGKTGVVYQAENDQHERVAVKVMSSEMAGDEESRARFLREAEALVALRHRNVVTMLGYGVDAGAPYLVMERLVGRTLRERMRLDEPMSTVEQLDLMIQLCDGLQFAHESGIVHRDVKPANIWLLPNGGLKLLDFGVAHFIGSTLTYPEGPLGSAAYMAPEQLAGEAVDGRADVFAAGVILFELLARRRPFEGDHISAVMEAILRRPTPSLAALVPGLSSAVCTAVATALAKDPADRYPHAADFASELRLAKYQIDASPNVPTSLPVPPAPVPPAPVIPVPVVPAPVVPAPVVPGSRPPAPKPPAPRPLRPRPPVPAPPSPPTGLQRLQRFLLALAGSRRVVSGLGIATAVVVIGAFSWWIWPSTDYRLQVQTVPAGAMVEIDGADSGVLTPATMTLPRRPARVRLRLEGYETADVGDKLTSGPSSNLDVKLTRQNDLRTEQGSGGGGKGSDDTSGSGRLGGPANTGGHSAQGSQSTPPGPGFQTGKGAGEGLPPPPPPPPPPPSENKTSVAVKVIGEYPFQVTGCGLPSMPAAQNHEFTVIAPCSLKLLADRYYLDVSRTIDATRGFIEFGVPQLARVELRSRLENCTILLADRAVGTPPVEIEVASGTYAIKVQCAEHTYTIRDFTIDPGRSKRRLDDLLQ